MAGLHKSADEAPRTKGVSHFCFSYNTYSNERVRSGWGELGKELVLAGWMGSVLELLVSLFFTFSLVAATFGWLAPSLEQLVGEIHVTADGWISAKEMYSNYIHMKMYTKEPKSC